MKQMMQAIRALRRIYNGPTAQAMGEAEQCDAHFDGGEWSGPAHARIQNDWMEQQQADVAHAFGVDSHQLGRQFHMSFYIEEGYRRESHER